MLLKNERESHYIYIYIWIFISSWIAEYTAIDDVTLVVWEMWLWFQIYKFQAQLEDWYLEDSSKLEMVSEDLIDGKSYKPLPEIVWTKFSDTIWCHWGSMC